MPRSSRPRGSATCLPQLRVFSCACGDGCLPSPQAFRTDPSAFLRRNSTDTLEFEAVAAGGGKAKLIPLYRVVDETYVAYFMTAGTKPPQPKVVYCPHSGWARRRWRWWRSEWWYIRRRNLG